MDNFGEWLENKLKEKKMSKSTLSKKSGLSRGTITNIISGVRGRGIDSITQIADALRIPPEEVFLAAIGRPLPEETEEMKEAAYRLNNMPPSLRSIIASMIDNAYDTEEAAEKPKRKNNPSPQGKKS